MLLSTTRIFQSSDTDSAFKLLYYCSKLTGLLPYSYTLEGTNFSFKFSITSLAWSTLVFVLYYSTYYNFLISELNSYDRNSVYELIGIPAKLCSVFSHMVALLTLWTNRRKLSFLITTLINIDSTLKLNHSHKLCVVVAEITTSFLLVVSSVTYFMFKKEASVSFFIMIPIVVSENIAEFQMMNIVCLLTQYFACVNLEMESASGFVRDALKRMKHLAELHEAARLTNEVYSCLMLGTVAVNFISGLYATYFLLSKYIGLTMVETSEAMWISVVFIASRVILQLCIFGKSASEVSLCCIYHLFTYIYCLLIEKYICDCRNVSIKLSFCVPFVHRSLHFFGKSILFLFLCFVLSVL